MASYTEAPVSLSGTRMARHGGGREDGAGEAPVSRSSWRVGRGWAGVGAGVGAGGKDGLLFVVVAAIQDQDTLAAYFIHQSVFIGDAAGPIAPQISF